MSKSESGDSQEIATRAIEAGWVEAMYRPAQLPEHRGNILVEALPPYAERAGPLELLANWPDYSAEERQKSKSYRLAALPRIRVLLETMPWHSEVMNIIYRLIWGGYSFRNPLDKKHQRIAKSYREVMASGKAKPLSDLEPTHASMSAILGGSGIGKSTIVRRLLSFLPQVIRHSEHGIVQLVWLYVECPPGGSVNDLLQWIINAADAVLDGGYVKDARRQRDTYNVRLSVLQTILNRHHLGIIVIDEIQNCLGKKVGKNQEKFFTSFPNLHRTPILHVGLPSVLKQYPLALHAARRLSDDGVYTLPGCMSDEEWDLLMEEMLCYQWTTEVADPTEIGPVLKSESAAIPAIAARLFQLAQAKAITEDKPRITAELIKAVAQSHLLPLYPVLSAIRSGDALSLGNYDPQMKDVGEAMDKSLESIGRQHERMRDLADKKRVSNTVRHAVSSIISLGHNENRAFAFISRLVKEHPASDSSWLVMQFLRDMEQSKERSKERGERLEEQVADAMKQEHEEMNGGAK